MRATIWRAALAAVALVLAACATSPPSAPVAEGTPFGGVGTAPALFAPGVVTIAEATTYRLTFTPDGRTVYYTLGVGDGYAIVESSGAAAGPIPRSPRSPAGTPTPRRSSPRTAPGCSSPRSAPSAWAPPHARTTTCGQPSGGQTGRGGA